MKRRFNLIYLILACCSLLNPLQIAQSKTSLAHWQKADINWRQYQGSHINVLADEQPAFMALMTANRISLDECPNDLPSAI